MTINLPSTALWKLASIKLGTFIGIVSWGFILWHDIPEHLSYISILYGMAVQLWISCIVGIAIGLLKTKHVICTYTECARYPGHKSNEKSNTKFK